MVWFYYIYCSGYYNIIKDILMMLFCNKFVLVLGGSCGIGVVIVWCFSVDGVLVVFSYVGLCEVVEKLVVEIGSIVI